MKTLRWRTVGGAVGAILVLAGMTAAQTGPNGAEGGFPINPEAAPRPEGQAAPASGPIVIDGRLDEPSWAGAQPMTGFWQQEPETGYPATQQTVVRILYDEGFLYLSALCYDPDPAHLLSKTLERDYAGLSVHNMDFFSFYLDTFLDRKNSFAFYVNPQGGIRDGQTFDDGRVQDWGWDGNVEVRTEVHDSGWTAEFAIPWTALRFDPTRDPQVWGLQFQRSIRRRNEETLWAPVDRQHKGTTLSLAGTLRGLPAARPGRNLNVKPFGVVKSTSGATIGEAERGGEVDGGLDLKYGITPRLTLDLTYRTDFSQVEVDREQVNLTRFPLFFPEKRDFFVENSGLFEFGDGVETNYRSGSSLRDFTLFHSRRIGLSGGRPVPIVAGGRMSGHLGEFDVGVLDMQTDGFEGGAPENVAVVRLRRSVSRGARVGLLFTSRQATDERAGESYNRVLGADSRVTLLRHLIVNSYFALTESPGADGSNTAARVWAGWRDALWNVSFHVKQVGDAFDPGVGFVRRTGVRDAYATVGLHPRPGIRHVLEVNPYAEVSYLTDLDDLLMTRTGTAGLGVLFRDGGELRLQYNDRFERLDQPFRVNDDATIPVGGYGFRESSVEYQSSKNRSVSGILGWSGGGYFSGTRSSLEGGLLWQPDHHFSVELSASHNDLTVAASSFTADVYATRLKYAYSTRLYFLGFVQYNGDADQMITNLRLNYIHSPLSDFFLVFTERRDAGGGVLERGLTAKLTKYVAF
ncbi:MAG: carbohydrate binding family 9 domain-containing protein [Gemmatimonadetes bacterium]|nr:carbohydrate binding family 9 domain-containing protein [Gemmatimonadota bacterium]